MHHRRTSQPGPLTRARAVALSAVLATAAATLSAAPATADPAAEHRAAAARVDALYAQAERATEKYNDAEERTGKLRARAATLQDRTARAQERVNRLRGKVGALAAADYRAGGIDPTLRLLLSERPGAYLEKAATLDRLHRSRAGELRTLLAARRVLDQHRSEAAHTLAELAAGREAVARHKQEVQRKLAAARRMLQALPADARTAYQRPSRDDGRVGAAPGTGGAVAPSGRAAAAVRAAVGALGAPYVWGSTGPSSFDCSGLTQWAYGRAGVSIPRTSQAQRGAGRRVPLSQARPGDLIIYRSDASHVALYVGGGQVVHAPHPGAQVRYEAVGMMPVSAVVRP
ncbi:C40 family peptidase [Streptomyces pinistramenti]|uniref:C40 family peptidase n=1 Tax=Streptomyces pinistramenti TaxID=2884812 RepID=UPI001D088E55|nr:C40 family peptidase [Streptomyces pinistramenti]MCB5910677.1 NlpC/P60 family protein [Streptomyces pinistramenti]